MPIPTKTIQNATHLSADLPFGIGIGIAIGTRFFVFDSFHLGEPGGAANTDCDWDSDADSDKNHSERDTSQRGFTLRTR
jgi:hypothetical protein